MSQALINGHAITGPITDPWEGTQAVPLVDVVQRASVSYEDVSYEDIRKAFREELVQPLPERGPHGRYLLSHDDAVMLLRAVALAALAGIAIVTAVRVLRAPGVSVEIPGAA